MRLRTPVGTRIEETERRVLTALDTIAREAGPGNVEITSDFLGVQPPSYPVNLIHLFTSGPGEAIIQVSRSPERRAARICVNGFAPAFRKTCPDPACRLKPAIL